MKPTVNILPEHLQLIQTILKKNLPPQTTVWVFGSRAKGNVKKFSDLDLAIDANGKPLSLEIIVKLAEDFDESYLPYKVDLVDWQNIDDNFRNLIQQDKILISQT